MGSDENEDVLLLQNLKRGDEKSFRRAYQKYHQPLYITALKYLRTKERAEDAVHDTYVKLWNKRKKLSTSGSLRGFLFTALRNHVLNIISKEKRHLKKEIEFTYEKKVQNKETENVFLLSKYRRIYQLAIEELPEKRRKIFQLRTEEGLTNGEVAEYLDVSIHTVKSQYYKGSKFIKNYVRERIRLKTGS